MNRPLANLKLYIRNACTDLIESHMISLDSNSLKLLINGNSKDILKNKIVFSDS